MKTFIRFLEKDETALRQGKRIIPVLYKVCPLPSALEKYQWTDFAGASDEAHGAQALKELVYACQDPSLNLTADSTTLYNQTLALEGSDPERAAILLQRCSTASASCLYDGEGHRVQQVNVAGANGTTTTTTSYMGSLEDLATRSDTGLTTTTAYYGGLAESLNGALSYLLSDGLGSVSESVATADGSVSATQLYGSYGCVRYSSGTLPTSKGFTGQRSDASTSGLDYCGARYYDPVAGQFTSADTTLAGGLNRYAYVAGNPETRTDPSGHRYVCPTGVCAGSATW